MQDEGGLGDETLENIASDYNFPIDFLFDALCRWGVSPPIRPSDKLGALVNGEQAFAIAELLNSVDPAEIHDFYLSETLEELVDELDVPLSDIFAIAGKERFSLPLGADTHITTEEYCVLLRELGLDDQLELYEAQQGRAKTKDQKEKMAEMNVDMSNAFSGDTSREVFADPDS